MSKSYKKLDSEELQAYLHARRSGHVHTDKTKIISRKRKYK